MTQITPAIDAKTVWAAACATYRINDNEYIKSSEENGRRANSELVREILKDLSQIQDVDRDQGLQARQYIRNAMTINALKGTLDHWGQTMARVSELDSINSTYDLSVICSLPATYNRYLEREKVHQRLSDADHSYKPKLKDKVEITAEVLENRYSRKWLTYYVTVVDTENRAWYFSYPKGMKKGSKVTVRGTVKRVMDTMSQLNRVKLVSGEA